MILAGGLQCTLRLTWSPVSLLHPNVAVALSYTCLRVDERHTNAPLSTQPGIVVVTLLHGIPVVLLSQPDTTKTRGRRRVFSLQTFTPIRQFCSKPAVLLRRGPPPQKSIRQTLGQCLCTSD